MKKLPDKIHLYYERELVALKQLGDQFATDFPAQAGQLGMHAGNRDDPHIERFIQATALSNARTAKLIDDNDSKVTEALLQVNYPHYLQAFPSCAIVQVDTRSGLDTMTQPGLIARGSTLDARNANAPVCRFRTIFDVPMTPVVLSNVAYRDGVDFPPSLPRATGATSMLSFSFSCDAANLSFTQLSPSMLRVLIKGEQSQCARTRDVLFMHAKTSYLEVDGICVALARVPIREVGFAPQDALLPRHPLSHQAYLLLTEYFVFPEKFNFFDIDWTALAPHLPPSCRRITLHLGLEGMSAQSPTSHTLGQLSHKNFVLGCTPVVNLFKFPACPINLTHAAPDYALLPDCSPVAACDIHSVDSVTTVQQTPHGQKLTEIRPYYSLRHGEAGGRGGRYYLVRRDPPEAGCARGHEMRITLVDLALDPLSIPDASVSIVLSCTNGNLPTRLGVGAESGDLTMEQETNGFPLRFLRRPTQQYRFEAADRWRLISQLSLGHCALSCDGLNLLKETLTLYDLPQSAVSQRQIAGIVGLEQRTASIWMRDDGHSSKVHGLAIRVTLDEAAFAGTGIHLFASVLDHFFGLYGHLHTFTQLTVLAQDSGKELVRCLPRNGALPLL